MSRVTDKQIISLIERRNLDPKDPRFISREQLEAFLESQLFPKVNKIIEILYRIFKDELITIAPCNGSRCIGKEEETFASYIDSSFASWGLNKPGKSTDATSVSIFEMIKNATFAQLFGSLGSDLDKLCLTQSQIVEFCQMYRDKLRQDGYATFFLFKEGDRFFVAHVHVDSDGLYAHVHRLEDGRVWGADCALRVVTPQLTV